MNPSYDEMKNSKMDPQYVLHYLCFQRIDLVNQYLQFFLNLEIVFSFKKHCDEFIENGHTAYLVKYVWRNTKDILRKN